MGVSASHVKEARYVLVGTAGVQGVAVAAPPGAGEPLVAGRLFVDTSGDARRAYGVAEGQDVVMVIRPDGYVGVAADCGAQTSDRLAQYLAAICATGTGALTAAGILNRPGSS